MAKRRRMKVRPKRLDFSKFYGGLFRDIGESVHQDYALVANLERELERARDALHARTAEYLFLKCPLHTSVVLQLNAAAKPAEYSVARYRRCPETGLTLPVFRRVCSGDMVGRTLTKEMAEKVLYVKSLHQYLREQDNLEEGNNGQLF